MGFSSDGTGADYSRISANSALDLPDGSFTFGGWVKVVTVPNLPYVVNMNGYGNNDSIAMYISGTQLRWLVQDSDGTTIGDSGVASGFADNTWKHLIVRRSTDDWQVWVNNSSVSGPTTHSTFDAVSSGSNPWVFGIRSDLHTDYRSNSIYAEWAKWSRALSTEEIAALYRGARPTDFPDYDWYVPFINSKNEASGLATTTAGMTIDEHAPIHGPGAQVVQFPPAAGGGGGSGPLFYHHRRLIGAN